jgi:hypothetical protein
MRKKCVRHVLPVVCGIGFAFAVAYAAPPADIIVNGDFETGTFAGWTVVRSSWSGDWAINDGAYHPYGLAGVLAPISGKYDAVSWARGGGVRALRQTITVPSGVFSARISWNDRVRNFANVFRDPTQEYRAVIRDLSGSVIQELYSTTVGDPLQEIGPNLRSADITGLMQANAGKTLVISFEEEDHLFFLNVTIDDVRLVWSGLPTDKSECKDDGWQSFVNSNTGLSVFKNQGDCVSFIASEGKNLPEYQ